MKSPENLNDKDLMDYADHHISYEIEMLIWCVALLGRPPAGNPTTWLPMVFRNSLLNSFSLHARNLIDFLYLRSLGYDRATDIIVEDYIDSGILNSVLPPITPLLTDVRRKTAKQAAHLTKDRINFEKAGKEWCWIEITKDIMFAFYCTAHLFPKARTSERFRERILQPPLNLPNLTANLVIRNGIETGISFENILLKIGTDWRVDWQHI